jgi:iron(III) transport system ATP-binding protein
MTARRAGEKQVASVELRNLTKRYDAATVVDDVSLRIDHGLLVCLLGPSGCGKTTTLRLIAGFVEPSAGEIAVGDRVVSSPSRTLPPEARKMSMIFQSYALWPHMTVAENVAYGLTLRKLPRAEVAKKVAGILATTRLADLAARYPGELSGGQQQRVALARALVVEPETLLLDEPLSNLDANLREEMRFEVRRLHDAYRYTTVYVTHDQSEAMTTADLIAVMNGGRIEQLGPPEEIYARPRSEFVARFIGASNILKGKALDAGHVSIAGAAIACSGGPLDPGAEVAISIRQHEIGIGGAVEPGVRERNVRENVIPATVARNVFLGNSRDYAAELGDGTMLRIVTTPEYNIAQGSRVWLRLPADRCRVLER